MKQKGITLIEMMIIIVITIILFLVIYGPVKGVKQGNEISFGANGLTEVRCIGGYKFVIGADGQARQMLNEFGKGAKCN
jgi:hypothetical protein